MDKKTVERITTKDQERCPTCDRIWDDPIGRYCSNSWHLATPDIMRRLSRLQYEHERAQQELQAYMEIIKELIPIAERTTITVDNSNWREQWEHKRTVIEKAKKLIDTVTTT